VRVVPATVSKQGKERPDARGMEDGKQETENGGQESRDNRQQGLEIGDGKQETEDERKGKRDQKPQGCDVQKQKTEYRKQRSRDLRK